MFVIECNKAVLFQRVRKSMFRVLSSKEISYSEVAFFHYFGCGSSSSDSSRTLFKCPPGCLAFDKLIGD